jgi:hypothetical protein
MVSNLFWLTDEQMARLEWNYLHRSLRVALA